jgi:hypothetical protein
MIDFVIPSVARPSLTRSLRSLLEQNYLFYDGNDDWKAFVGFDGIPENRINTSNLLKDDRINYLFIENKMGKVGEWGMGNAGLVRNEIIKNISSPNKWMAFLDDDDTVTPYYVDSLFLETTNSEEQFDCVVFRMRFDPSGEKILPPIDEDELIQDKVGISFCVRKEFLNKTGIKFINDSREDFKFLMELKNAGASIKISNYITYNVGF